MNSCTWIMDNETECGERCEGNTPFCGSHNRQLRKESEQHKKQQEKRKQTIQKANLKASVPRKAPSKNPKDWGNTFLCSDGTRVTQNTINSNYKEAKLVKHDGHKGHRKCEGCGTWSTANAHIIAQARCKVIGKTELIWFVDNFFPACNRCNMAIENPKGKEWKRLKNIEKCLSFIKQHDPELYTKFELSAVNQETPTI